jgi:Beta-propeller repeat
MKTLLFLFITLCSFRVSAQTTNWVKQAGATSRATNGTAIAVDATGNSYVTGNFSGTATFGGFSLTAFAVDVFVAKYNNSGVIQWVKQIGGAGSFPKGNSIAVDASGNILLTGYFTNTTDFGGTSLTPVGNNDVFVAKFNNSGTLQWVKQAGSAGKYNIAYGVAVNSSGNVFVTGKFQGVTNFSGTTLTAVGTDDIFVANFNSSGTLVWVNQAGAVGSSDNIGNAIAVDASSNIYVTGKFAKTTNFSGTSVTSIGAYDLFVASYSSAGALNWIRNSGTPSIFTPPAFITSFPIYGTAITVKNGNVFVTGQFIGSPNFGGITLNSPTYVDAFLAKYNTAGSVSWVNRIGKIERFNTAYGVAADESGNSYLVGEFGFSTDFGGTTLTAIGTRDAFVGKYNPSGSLQWVKQYGAISKFAGVLGVGVDATGSIYSIGYFSGTTNFGGTTLSPIGNQDAFILSLQASTTSASFESATTGNWDVASTWVCNCIPNGTLPVRIMSTHIITVPTTYIGQAKGLQFMGTGKVTLQGTGKVNVVN